jgi:hypothetical protein
MASILNVDSIRNSSGVGGIDIASDGKVTMPSTPIEIDMWRLPSDFTSNNSIITTWTRPTYTGYSKVGTGMTHSSGIFTFPVTGLWRVVLSFRTNLVSTDTSAGCIIELSTDGGSSFTELAGAFENRNSNSSLHTHALINCTDISTFQVRIEAAGLDTGSKISSHPTRVDTNIMFERITDSQ